MKLIGREETERVQDENDVVSLCSMFAGGESFGIDTRKIREVLGKRELQRVPLAPSMIGGVVPYRGEVLTTVNFRALLGMESYGGAGCILVLAECRYAILVSGCLASVGRLDSQGVARQASAHAFAHL